MSESRQPRDASPALSGAGEHGKLGRVHRWPRIDRSLRQLKWMLAAQIVVQLLTLWRVMLVSWVLP
jgi:hypothetical protein